MLRTTTSLSLQNILEIKTVFGCRMAQKSQLAEQCKAAGKPKLSQYKPKGKTTKLGDLEIYEIGVGKRAIILLYDIFGWNSVSKNVFEFADLLAKNGFRVIMPDHFRGEPCNIADFPPTSDLQKQAFASWKAGIGSTIVMRKDIYERVLPHLYASNVNDVGCIGFCWGTCVSYDFLYTLQPIFGCLKVVKWHLIWAKMQIDLVQSLQFMHHSLIMRL